HTLSPSPYSTVFPYTPLFRSTSTLWPYYVFGCTYRWSPSSRSPRTRPRSWSKQPPASSTFPRTSPPRSWRHSLPRKRGPSVVRVREPPHTPKFPSPWKARAGTRSRHHLSPRSTPRPRPIAPTDSSPDTFDSSTPSRAPLPTQRHGACRPRPSP